MTHRYSYHPFFSSSSSSSSSFTSINILTALHSRSSAVATSYNPLRLPHLDVSAWTSSQFLSSLSCNNDSVHTVCDPFADSLCPVFCVRYHPSANYSSTLLAADENGWVSLFDTQKTNSEQSIATRTRFQAVANTTVYDIQWCGAENAAVGSSSTFLTAAADLKVKLWDLNSQECLATLIGHKGSVKVVRSQPGQSNVVLSGSRDGDVRIWDLRESQSTTPVSQDEEKCRPSTYTLKQVHYTSTASSSSSSCGSASKSAKRKRNDAAVSEPGVTALAFASPNILLTGGAKDGEIRAWDLRMIKSKCKQGMCITAAASTPSTSSSSSSARKRKSNDTLEPVWQISEDLQATRNSPSPTSSASSTSTRSHGICSLSFDRSGQRLLVNSYDHIIRVYDLISSSQHSTYSTPCSSSHTPIQYFSGHKSNFYIKASWSPCGRYIACGSANAQVCVWDTKEYKYGRTAEGEAALMSTSTNMVQPCKILDGHSQDVNDVAWNPHYDLNSSSASDHSPFQLASCSDDSTIRVWNVDDSDRSEGIGEIVDRIAEMGLDKPISAAAAPQQKLSDTFATYRPVSPYASTVITSPSFSHNHSSNNSPHGDTEPRRVLSSPQWSASSSGAVSPSNNDQDDMLRTQTAVAQRERSLSPANRRMTSSSRQFNTVNRDVATSALEFQLTTHLTVSPSKVELAREAHSGSRHRRRQQYEAKEEEEEAAAAIPVPAATTSSSHSRPPVARMLPVFGATLPFIQPDATVSAATATAASSYVAPFGPSSASNIQSSSLSLLPPPPGTSFSRTASALQNLPCSFRVPPSTALPTSNPLAASVAPSILSLDSTVIVPQRAPVVLKSNGATTAPRRPSSSTSSTSSSRGKRVKIVPLSSRSGSNSNKKSIRQIDHFFKPAQSLSLTQTQPLSLATTQMMDQSG